jgi:hypothetical protein
MIKAGIHDILDQIANIHEYFRFIKTICKKNKKNR